MYALRVMAALLVIGGVAHAHFVFVVPQKDGKSVQIVFSDSLEPDENVAIEKIAGLKLLGRSADGKTTPIDCKKAAHSLTAEFGTIDPKCVMGSVDYGVIQKGDTKPYLLKYHPRAILPGCDQKLATVGETSPIEIIPIAGPKLVFQVLALGKPLPDAEVTVMVPGDKSVKVKTDSEGRTQAFEAIGRYGVWTKRTETKTGDVAGMKYDEIRHYATLVVDSPAKK